MQKTIYLQQPIIPDYRLDLFLLLRKDLGSNFEVFAGENDFGGTPLSCNEAWNYFQYSKNYYLFGGCFLWQIGCFRKLLSADLTILNSNMRILSNNLILLLRKLLGRRTILWGHAAGQSALGSCFRSMYLRLCDGFISYTETQKKMLRQNYSWLKVWNASNALMPATKCVPVEAEFSEIDSILYVGRLIEPKKVNLLLESFIYARTQCLLPDTVKLFFIGDGKMRIDLETLARKTDFSNSIHFIGHISDVDKLRSYYRKAICSVSPGYVGLSAIQSFSFGIPMLVADNELHSPEIEACKKKFNSKFFSSNNFMALAEELSAFYKERAIWLKNRSVISEWIRNHYSLEAMRDAFVQAIEETTA